MTTYDGESRSDGNHPTGGKHANRIKAGGTEVKLKTDTIIFTAAEELLLEIGTASDSIFIGVF